MLVPTPAPVRLFGVVPVPEPAGTHGSVVGGNVVGVVGVVGVPGVVGDVGDVGVVGDVVCGVGAIVPAGVGAVVLDGVGVVAPGDGDVVVCCAATPIIETDAASVNAPQSNVILRCMLAPYLTAGARGCVEPVIVLLGM